MTSKDYKEKLKEIDYLNGSDCNELLLSSGLNKDQEWILNHLINICKEYNCSADFVLGLSADYYGD